MRKKLLLLAVSLLGMASAQAQTLSVDNFEVLKGKTGTLAVNVTSATNVRDLQFDIVIPAGVTLGTPAPAADTYKVAASDPTAVEGGNKYTVILYSESAAKGATTINFPLEVPSTFEGELWANLTSSTSEGKWTNDAAAETAMASYPSYTFQIGLLGDANKSGGVNIADVSTIIGAVVGGNPTPYSELAANANETGGVNIADVSAVLGIITGSGE